MVGSDCMKLYYDDGECGRFITEIQPTVPSCKAQCIPFSEIAYAVTDYCIRNRIDNPDYEHFLIVQTV